MSGDASPVGRCPQCGREIPEAYLLIEYETEAGETGRWAECPECDEVVSPNSIE
jgi:DNA-directed RNA polymerase subunit RPC12/RpoP